MTLPAGWGDVVYAHAVVCVDPGDGRPRRDGRPSRDLDELQVLSGVDCRVLVDHRPMIGYGLETADFGRGELLWVPPDLGLRDVATGLVAYLEIWGPGLADDVLSGRTCGASLGTDARYGHVDVEVSLTDRPAVRGATVLTATRTPDLKAYWDKLKGVVEDACHLHGVRSSA